MKMISNRIDSYFFKILLTAVFLLLLSTSASAKVYIDIIKAPRPLPIAIMDLSGPYGIQLSAIIREDLELTGLFQALDRKSFVELPSKPFVLENWRNTDAEIVFKGAVVVDEMVKVSAQVYDAFDGTVLLNKRYKSTRELLRPLAHAIANDIYEKLTAKQGVFRTRIAFITREDGNYKLNMSDWDGLRVKALSLQAFAIIAPQWSPDGNRLLYSAQKGTKWGVYETDFSDRSEELLLSLPGTTIVGGYFPDGLSFLLSSSEGGSPDIYSYDIPSRKKERLTRDMGIEVSPSVNAEGTIVFVSDRGGTPQIYTMDKSGYNKLRVTYEGRYNTSPSWSPDGKLIVYSGRVDGLNQIFTIRPDGGGLKQLTTSGNNESPHFSPDGRFIVFSSDREGKKGIYVIRANGDDSRRISPPGVEAFSPRWSPN